MTAPANTPDKAALCVVLTCGGNINLSVALLAGLPAFLISTAPTMIVEPTPSPPTTTAFVIDFDVDEFLADFRWDFGFGWGMDPLAQTFTVPNVPG